MKVGWDTVQNGVPSHHEESERKLLLFAHFERTLVIVEVGGDLHGQGEFIDGRQDLPHDKLVCRTWYTLRGQEELPGSLIADEGGLGSSAIEMVANVVTGVLEREWSELTNVAEA
ncbi:MAG: hypothetical protein HN348_33405 [Proteobacteria bacterium]|jgi:hypothetical protein|nr:hypothetical protein [Pseudomonadota bacterium]